ncbi:hypothetical protein [Shewanella maritima]|uniref:hypothetical protein n=1 Tax=Shewanella maritima TaxID=2520507 RepID=UPI003736F2CA
MGKRNRISHKNGNRKLHACRRRTAYFLGVTSNQSKASANLCDSPSELTRIK